MLLDELAEIIHSTGDTDGARASKILAEHYRSVPQISDLSVEQAEKVLRYIQEYFACYQSYLLDASDQQLFRFTERWLDETFSCLGNHLQLYYRWAIGAQVQDTLSFYPGLDECLWELENRSAMLLEDE